MKPKVIILLLTLTIFSIKGQDFVISKEYKDLVELKKVVPGIILDIKYATSDNFVKQVVYSSDRCFIHKDVAVALKEVVTELNKRGLTLKVWDGFRPVAAQRKFWEICPDPKYVSEPSKGGRHTRGTAIDCTLVDIKTGKELEMGTAFDDFTENASPSCTKVCEEAQSNRKILQTVMNKHGFAPVNWEWWHFDFTGWSNYPVLDVNPQDIS
jgi:D-alanyl-D-alanine dipeptidase